MELHERRQRILAAVVDDYVETAEPVGSATLVRKHDFGVKPATIRNELAAMSEMGYLRQPHTSAGRVPSDMGYRFYVDKLMPEPTLPLDETYNAKQSCDNFESEIGEILQQTGRILSGLTKYISLVTSPRIDVVSISQVALVSVKPGRLLVITVLNSGHVDHRATDYQGNLSDANIVSLGNLLNTRFHSAELNNFDLSASEELPSELRLLDWLYKKAVAAVKQSLITASDAELYVDGAGYILKEPEFFQSNKASTILDALERRRSILMLLSGTLLGNDVTVIIGSENGLSEMKDCSFIASSYSIDGKACGSVGVIGPTRMNYRHSVAAVKFMSSNLSKMLSSLSIG